MRFNPALPGKARDGVSELQPADAAIRKNHPPRLLR